MHTIERVEINGKNYQEGLQKAYHFAENTNGEVCSMTNLLDLRIKSPFSDDIWTSCNSHNAISERMFTRTRINQKPVVLIIHGKGPTTDYLLQGGTVPDPFKTRYGVPLEREVILQALDGKLEDGTEIPIFPFKEYKQLTEIPEHHGIVMDRESAFKKDPKRRIMIFGGDDYRYLLTTPSFLAAVGGTNRAIELRKKLEGYSWQICSHGNEIDFDENIGRQLLLDFEIDTGESRLNEATYNVWAKHYSVLFESSRK